MKNSPITVALIYGGRSAEHEVSLRSSASVFSAMDRDRYRIIPVMISREGGWYRLPADISSFTDPGGFSEADRVLLPPDPTHMGGLLVVEDGCVKPLPIDVAFPVLHGTYGEDGTLQGVFEMANIPYVGCGVTASAVGMDKVFMKGAFRDNGLLVGPFFWFLRSQWQAGRDEILQRLKRSRFPVFVKPANLGSSVGISRVADSSQFEAAVDKAASFDRKILVEDGIPGRELEVGVLGNDDPKASVAGEVVSHSDFYDYEEKYLKDTAELIIPAQLSEEELAGVQEAATTAFRAVDGSGLSRVDLFLTPEDSIVVNEINTLPGFTSISMYPKLWETSGLSYDKLIDTLVDLAFERFHEKQTFQTSRM
ncbi:MAG: D-alanine--D-alanine ligase family protein [Pseudomonadota bacterium]